ncbi:hypothetical protein [Haloprofundus halobius]|uniref:hypothetical protein n=1 Tax=Haloprofundus halobius TaxID=2876194 RepID=UPI001CC93408|nr:hypothetical protein [Haloprofundus halobius]
MFDSLKRPEYTGLNRCYPCTILNIVLLVGLGFLVTSVSVVGASILLIIGGVSIWFRGYIIPYTPFIGPWFRNKLFKITGQEIPSGSNDGSLASDDMSGERVVEELLRTDILELTGGDDLVLSEPFRSKWRAKMEEVRRLDLDKFERWATMILQDCDISGVEAKDQRWADSYVVVTFPFGEESILRYPVAVAEFSSLATLEGYGLEPPVRLHSCGPLRGFLTECPLCDTPLEVSRYDGCCGNPRAGEESPGLICKQCRTVLYKFPK